MSTRTINRLQSLTAVTLFVIVFYACYSTTKFKLTEIPLSYYGVYSKYKFFWNTIIMLLLVSILINIKHYIYYKKMLYSKYLELIFSFLSLCLFLVGLIPMPSIIHTISAYIYFFGYPLAIFLMTQLNKKQLGIKLTWLLTILSTLMMLIPLYLFKIYDGHAYAETANIIIMIIFNFIIL